MQSPVKSLQPSHQLIHIQPLAATKPLPGAPCNGCGLCCLAEPCPLGVLLSRSRKGPCKALQWDETERQYRCGALGQGRSQHALARLKAWVVRRWIAAGVGCDCDLEPLPAATISTSTANDKYPDNGRPHD
jgi:hypothetical protein